MATTGRKRLMLDFQRLQREVTAGISGAPMPYNILKWQAVIFGPIDTPFEDGVFRLTMEFSELYPSFPPVVRFITKMFHPNIYEDGRVCVDILQDKWSPAYDVHSILTSIMSLLSDPNPNSPANSLAARLYKTNRRAYEVRVMKTVEHSFIREPDLINLK